MYSTLAPRWQNPGVTEAHGIERMLTQREIYTRCDYLQVTGMRVTMLANRVFWSVAFRLHVLPLKVKKMLIIPLQLSDALIIFIWPWDFPSWTLLRSLSANFRIHQSLNSKIKVWITTCFSIHAFGILFKYFKIGRWRYVSHGCPGYGEVPNGPVWSTSPSSRYPGRWHSTLRWCLPPMR
jgi:hypothetical protein